MRYEDLVREPHEVLRRVVGLHAVHSENAEAIWTMADEGVIRPNVHAELPLDRWREAFDLLAERKVVGKAVIAP